MIQVGKETRQALDTKLISFLAVALPMAGCLGAEIGEVRLGQRSGWYVPLCLIISGFYPVLVENLCDSSIVFPFLLESSQ